VEREEKEAVRYVEKVERERIKFFLKGQNSESVTP